MKIFTESLQNLIGRRFDPEFVAFTRRQALFMYPQATIGRLLVARPEYGAAESGAPRESMDEVRYVRITDIDENGELSSDLGATAENIENKYLLSHGDLLFARSGNTVGKCYCHDAQLVSYPCIYAGYLIRYRFNHDLVLPRFIFAVSQTSYFRDWVLAVRRAAGQPNINAQEFSSLAIPLPPLDVQRRIVAELDEAYAAKRAADQKAADLLRSIDDMVLEELGIDLACDEINDLTSRIFSVQTTDLLFDRFDAFFNQPRFVLFAKEIRHDLRYRRLGSIGTFVRGVVYSADDESEKGHAILRANNISLENRVIDTGDLLYVDSSVEFDLSQRIRRGDILICAASGSKEHAGKVAYICDDIPDAYIGGFMVALRVETGVNAEYVVEYMQSSVFRQLIYRHLGGTNINNVSLELLNKLPLILPSIPVQERIVRKAKAMKAEARKLKAEAAAKLESAKRKMEGYLWNGGDK